MYTDGVTEAGRPATMFGEQRLADVIAAADDRSARAIVATIEAALGRLAENDRRDDVAILAIRAPGT